MERRNFQGANRKHNSDLSVCHTAHTHTHTHLDTQSRKKKTTRTKKQKSLSSRESGTVICPWSNGRIHHLLQPAELHHSPQQAKPPWQEQRERGGVLRGRADSSWGMLTCALSVHSFLCVFLSAADREGLWKVRCWSDTQGEWVCRKKA